MFITEAEAAEMLGVDQQIMARMRKGRGGSGVLPPGPPFLTLGRQVIRYRKSDLDAWIEEQIATCRDVPRRGERSRKATNTDLAAV